MDQIPPIVYLMPVIGIVLFFVMRARMKSTLTQGEAANAAARAGEIAQRIGLTVVEGDPNLNLLYAHSFILAGTLKEARVRLEGSPTGRAGDVSYYERQEVKTGFSSTTITTFFDGRVSVEVRAPFPEFEVLLRNPPQWVGTPKLKVSASAHPFGDPVLDGQFVLRAVDARIGPVLAEGLYDLLAHQYVHVFGKEGRVTFALSVETLSCLSLAEQIYVALDKMARSIEHAAAQHGA